MSTNTTAQVLSPDGDAKFFEIPAEVFQGDTLAPYLFIIALDYTMRQATGNESKLYRCKIKFKHAVLSAKSGHENEDWHHQKHAYLHYRVSHRSVA